MKLIPGDLGLYWQVRLMQARDNPAKLGADVPLPRTGRLTRWYGRGAELSDAEASALVPVSTATLTGSLIGIASVSSSLFALAGAIIAGVTGIEGGLGIVTGLLGGGIFSVVAGATGGRFLFSQLLKRPLGEEEVSRLLERTADPLHRQYLGLVRDAVRQPVPAESEANLREALRALAETISTLPPLEHRPLDLEALRTQAAQLLAEAATQADRITGESIERRARAIQYRIEAHERALLLAQRNRALRAEVEAQMHALREGLVALQAPTSDPHGFAALAAAARQVASEAGHIASARDELETAITGSALPQPGLPAGEELQVAHARTV